jgi:hypothetical protein
VIFYFSEKKEELDPSEFEVLVGVGEYFDVEPMLC